MHHYVIVCAFAAFYEPVYSKTKFSTDAGNRPQPIDETGLVASPGSESPEYIENYGKLIAMSQISKI